MVNKVAKGNRFELQVKKILEERGFIVYKPTRTKFTTQKDVWNMFDLLAWHPQLKHIVFLQITNRSYVKDKVNAIKDFTPEEIFAGVFSKEKQVITFYGKIETLRSCEINLKVAFNAEEQCKKSGKKKRKKSLKKPQNKQRKRLTKKTKKNKTATLRGLLPGGS